MNIQSILKNSGSALLGFAIIAGLILLSAVIWVGVTAVSAFIYPVITFLAGIAFLAFIFLVLPLSLFHSFRPFLAATSIVLSYICGVSVWMYSFLVIVSSIKWGALFLLFLFQAVAPIACIIFLFQGKFSAAGEIIVGLVITYGIRIYGFWLGNLYEKKQGKVIEIKASEYEVSEGKVVNGSRICSECFEKNNPSFKNCWKCGSSFLSLGHDG